MDPTCQLSESLTAHHTVCTYKCPDDAPNNVNGVCVWTCPEGYVWEYGHCVIECESGWYEMVDDKYICAEACEIFSEIEMENADGQIITIK